MPEAVSDGLFDVPGVPMTSDATWALRPGHRWRCSASGVTGRSGRPNHLLAPGSLRRLVEKPRVASVILYGPRAAAEDNAGGVDRRPPAAEAPVGIVGRRQGSAGGHREFARKALLHGGRPCCSSTRCRFKTQQDACNQRWNTGWCCWWRRPPRTRRFRWVNLPLCRGR